VTIQLASTATKHNAKQLRSPVVARTYVRTNATDARIQDLEKIVQLLTVRAGLWISRFSGLAVAL
jgi:hypothetical protein